MAVTLNLLFSNDSQLKIKNNIRVYSGYYSDNWIYTSAPLSNWSSISVNKNNGFMIAIADAPGGVTPNIMYSEDGGITWINYSVGPLTNAWKSITFGNNRFVAVGNGPTNYVMYSTNSAPKLSTDWVLISSGTNGTANNSWQSITYDANTFIAISNNGTNRSMYSNDGINWITRPVLEQNSWRSISYGNGYFIAVSNDGNTNKRLMYSLNNGKSWYDSTNLNYDTAWISSTYSPKLNRFVIIGGSGGTSNYFLAYSNDAINWTGVIVPNKNWSGVVWSQELEVFIAIASTSVNGIMSSSDGINWITRLTSENNAWKNIIWNRYFGSFLSVSSNGTNRITRSIPLGINVLLSEQNYYDPIYFNLFSYGFTKKIISVFEDFFITPILNIPNNNISYSISPDLPTGISINAFNGIISGNYTNFNDLFENEYTVTATTSFLNQKLKTKIILKAESNLKSLSNFFYNNGVLIFNVNALKEFRLLANIEGSTPITFSISPNPPVSVSFDPRTGTISGVFSGDFDQIYTIIATNPLGNLTTRIRIISKNIPPSVFSYYDNVPFNGLVGSTISLSPSTNLGTNLTYEISPTPMIGTLNINSSTGIISGNLPSIPTSVLYTITARNTQGFQFYRINISSANRQISGFTYNPVPRIEGYTYDGPYNFVASISTGTNVSYDISPSSLPAGLSFNKNNGNITGNITSSTPAPLSYTSVATSPGVISQSYQNIFFNIKAAETEMNITYKRVSPAPQKPPIIRRLYGGLEFYSSSISTPRFHNSSISFLSSFYSFDGAATSSYLRVNGDWTSNPGWTYLYVTSLNGRSKTFTRPDRPFTDGVNTWWYFSGSFSDEWFVSFSPSSEYVNATLGFGYSIKVLIK